VRMKKQKCITSPKKRKKDQDTTIDAVGDLITIVMICDTPGYRMKSYGPPSLIKIGDKRLIDHQIDAIGKRLTNFEIILCVGFDAERVGKHIRSHYPDVNVRIVENQVFNDSNTCEGMRLALNNTNNDKILVLDGNIMFSPDILSQIKVSQSCVLGEKEPSDNLEIGFNLNESEQIEHFAFGASQLWSEIFFLSNREAVETLRKIVSGAGYKTKFMFEALNDLIKTRHKMTMIANQHPIKKINNIKTYHKIRRQK